MRGKRAGGELSTKSKRSCCCIDLDQKVLMFFKCNFPASCNGLLCAKLVTRKLNQQGPQRILILMQCKFMSSILMILASKGVTVVAFFYICVADSVSAAKKMTPEGVMVVNPQSFRKRHLHRMHHPARWGRLPGARSSG